jgi:hypothetical protein
MTRKFLVPLRTEIATLIPDNTTGLVSPADVRTMLTDVLDSAVNSDAFYASNTVSPGFAITNAGAIPPAPSPVSSVEAPTFVNVDPGTRVFAVGAPCVGFSLLVQCQCTVGAPNNVDMSLELFASGISTIFSAEITGTGTGNPATMSFSAYIQHAVAGTLDMRLRSLTGNTTVDVQNSSMAVIILPTETAT